MSRNGWVLLSMLALGLALVGCEGASTQAAPSRSVALIDLDRIAKALGRDQELGLALKTSQDSMQSTLNDVRNQLLAQIQAEETRIGATPTPEQVAGLNKMRVDAEAYLRARLGEAQQEQARKQASLIAQFRDEVRPHALNIMNQRGMSLVMVKHEGVLVNDPEADITDQVIKVMLEPGNRPATGMTPAPPVPPMAPPTTQP